MGKEFTYSKQEKLKSRKLLEAIFKKGQSFTVYPIKLFYLQPDEPVD
jgi:ribonuclease P protein component